MIEGLKYPVVARFEEISTEALEKTVKILERSQCSFDLRLKSECELEIQRRNLPPIEEISQKVVT